MVHWQIGRYLKIFWRKVGDDYKTTGNNRWGQVSVCSKLKDVQSCHLVYYVGGAAASGMEEDVSFLINFGGKVAHFL